MRLEKEITKVCEKLENGYKLLELDNEGDLINNNFNNSMERFLEEIDNYLTFGTYVEDNLYYFLDKVDNECEE